MAANNIRKRWTKQELDYITQAYTHQISPETISTFTERSVSAIRTAAWRYGCYPRTDINYKAYRWTGQEEALLRENYPRLSAGQLAHKLGRSYHSVKHKIKYMGL